MSSYSQKENGSVIISDSEDDEIDGSFENNSCHVIDCSTTDESNITYENQSPIISKSANDGNTAESEIRRKIKKAIYDDLDDEKNNDYEGRVEHHRKSISSVDSDDELPSNVHCDAPSSDSDEPRYRKPRVRRNIISDYSSDEKEEDSISTVSTEYDKDNTPTTANEIIDITSSKDNSGDGLDIAVSLAEEEIGVENIDPFTSQKKAILISNMQQIKNQLMKYKMLLNTANIDMLPDKGDKLRQNIVMQEMELEKLGVELKNMPLTETIEPSKIDNIKKSTKETLSNQFSAGCQVKPLGKRAQETWNREKTLTIDRIQDLHDSLAARPTEETRAENPKGLKITLMLHQQHALAWLLWRERQKLPGGVLADDMGLGKTLTMIALILASNDKEDFNESSDSDEEWIKSKKAVHHKGGTLVVCPASILHQWEGEIVRHCKRGVLSVEVYHGCNRENLPKRMARNDVVITTYNLVAREFKANSTLFKIRWKRVILDEAHIIRNHKSQASVAVCNLEARNRWALTGTPIQNKGIDLYAILKFLKCAPFDDLRIFKHWVDNKSAAGQQRLTTVMKSLMLRRTKQELQAKGNLESLPNKSLEIIEIKLDPEEQLIYEKILVFSRTLFAQFLCQRAEKQHLTELYGEKYEKTSLVSIDKNVQFTKAQNQLLTLHADVKTHEILVLLLRLRQICCHPALINAMLNQQDLEQSGIENDEGLDIDLLSRIDNMKLEDTGEDKENEIGVDQRISKNLLTSKNPVFDVQRQNSKMRAVLATIEEILRKGDKVVIVSQWTSMLDIVELHLRSLKVATCCTLTGKVAVKDRKGVVDSFNDPNSDLRILLLSLTAGGVGLNLTGGNHLLLLDAHWNPQLEEQAQDRIYRFGQTKDVYIYKYICKETIEERIKMLQDHKLNLAKDVLTGVRSNAASKLTLDDIKSLFSAF